MNDAPAAPPVPRRTIWVDLLWVLAGSLTLALFSGALESPGADDGRVWWASAGLAAMLATAPRTHWATLSLAALAMFCAALALSGRDLDVALMRALAYALEGLAGGWLATRWLARTQGAATPLSFGLLLLLAALAPSLVGATTWAVLIEVLSRGPGASGGATPFAAHWLATYAGDSFGALGAFPLVLALRRQPIGPVTPREVATGAALVTLVVAVTQLSFVHLPRPFGFCSLVLGAAALLAGPRSMFAMVWACMATTACALARLRLHGAPPDLQWRLVNAFLPVMAVVLPIQVLSMALQRLNQARDVLQRSRARFRSLYEHAPVMLQSLDERGRTTEVNAQWLATLGYDSAAEVRGMPFDRFVMHDDNAPAHHGAARGRPWHRLLLDAAPQKLHVRLRTASGHAVAVLASAATRSDEPGSPSGVVLAFEDVSVELAMREEIERERDQLAALSSATNDLAIFLDRELRYRSVNRAFERCWGIARADVLGRHPSEVPGQSFFATGIAAPLARALAGEASNFQALIEFPGGPRVMEIGLAPAFDAGGEKAGVVATLHDVTPLVEATRELRQRFEELQHANEGLEQFARIASHDLREPLNTISQFAGLIEQDFGGVLPAEATRWFGLMGQAAERMKAMLDDVLQFARLDRMPQVGLETVLPERVFADLRMLLHARIAQTRTTLVVATPLPPVLGQPSLVQLLFQNLLLNAMRYTAPGIDPRVEVTARRLGDIVVLTVADNGIGIAQADLERVFMPFNRLLASRRQDGSGLGLAICRRIAIALGGRVWAESDGVHGSLLHVALQAAGAREDADRPAAEPTREAEKRRPAG